MNPTVLGEGKYVFGDRIRNKIIICIMVIAVAAAFNILIMQVCTKENLMICIPVNIVLDIAVGWFVVWQLDRFILPGRKLLSLYKGQGTIISGEVEGISEKTERYCGFDCWVVTVSGHKVFVVDNDTIFLKVGQKVSLEATHGIVKEVLQ